jgi:hypothetical protein
MRFSILVFTLLFPFAVTAPAEYLLAPVTDLDQFVFDGVAGDSVRVSIRSNSTLDPWLEARMPGDPDPIESTRCNGVCTITADFDLTTSGTHALSVFEWGADHTGDYSIQLERIPTPAPQLSLKIPYDFPFTVQLDPSTDHDFVTFDGTAGTSVRVTIRSESTLDPRLEIWGPTGTSLKNLTCNGVCTLSTDVLLDASGTHWIGFSEWGKDHTGDIEVSIQCLFGNCPDDIDQDGVTDLADNCFRLGNSAQQDTDGDGYGNRCDADLDNNVFVNSIDFSTFKQRLLTTDPDADLDGSGFVNSIDFSIFKTLLLCPPGPTGRASSQD